MKIILKKTWLLLLFLPVYGQEKLWTWSYKKKFSQAQQKKNAQRHEITLEKNDIPSFSQLIFSWNAFRPTKGHFTFFVQVRDAATQQWSSWYKMIEWGAGIQSSFFIKKTIDPTYHHVRLEMPEHSYADAFTIKVVSHQGAMLDNVVALFVSVSNFDHFKAEAGDRYNKFPSVHIKEVPLLSQMVLDHPKKEVLCSPTSCSMVIGYFNKEIPDPLSVAQAVYDSGLNAYGSWPFNSAHLFEQTQGRVMFFVTRLHSFEKLYNYLAQKMPVIVSVRGPLSDAPREYAQGHLLVVVGWDQERRKVLCHDPGFSTPNEVAMAYDLSAFLHSWERSRRLAYVPHKNF